MKLPAFEQQASRRLADGIQANMIAALDFAQRRQSDNDPARTKAVNDVAALLSVAHRILVTASE